jgi:hypothetical protein
MAFAQAFVIKTKLIRDAQTRPLTAPSAKRAKTPESYNMSPQPHEGPAEQECSSGSVSPVATEPERTDCFRKLLSGFSHRCRNSLNGIKMSLYLFRREARGDVPLDWAEIESTYQQLESLFDYLQLIYRPITLTTVRCSLGQLIRDHQSRWCSSFQSKGRTLELDPPEQELEGDFDPMQIGIGLDALAKWRTEVGESRSETRLGWRTLDGAFEICWEEVPTAAGHRPMVRPREAEIARESKAWRRTDSLVVLLLDRILAAHGGRLERPSDVALRWTMRWPLHQDSAGSNPTVLFIRSTDVPNTRTGPSLTATRDGA